MKFAAGEFVKIISKREILSSMVVGHTHYVLYAGQKAKIIEARTIHDVPLYTVCIDRQYMWWDEFLLKKVVE